MEFIGQDKFKLKNVQSLWANPTAVFATKWNSTSFKVKPISYDACSSCPVPVYWYWYQKSGTGTRAWVQKSKKIKLLQKLLEQFVMY